MCKRAVSLIKEVLSPQFWNDDENENDPQKTKIHLKSRLHMINKVHPDLPTVNQIRPITINSILYKFVELTLTSKLQNWINQNIPISQTGFRQKHGTQFNLCRVVNRLKNGNHKFVIFYDLKKAFDTVPRDKVLELLT